MEEEREGEKKERERERPSANSTYLAIARVTTITLHGPLLAWVNAKSIVSIECARFLRARSCVRMDLFSLTSENLNSLLPTLLIYSPHRSIHPSIHRSIRGTKVVAGPVERAGRLKKKRDGACLSIIIWVEEVKS